MPSVPPVPIIYEKTRAFFPEMGFGGHLEAQDEGLMRVGVGAIGEITVAGPGLASGYLTFRLKRQGVLFV